MAGFYKEVKGSVICTLPKNQEVRYFIPECYFSSKSAIIVGEFVNLLGIFNYAIYDIEKDKPISNLKTFYFPTVFLAQPYVIEKAKDIVLTKNSGKQDYRVLKFKDGDKLVVQTSVPQFIENVEEFFKLFVLSGHIPDTIDYRNIYKYFIDAMELSGNKWDSISNQIFGILQSEICRDPKDHSRPFRLSEAKKRGEWDNYKNISIKEIPNYISSYVSLTSENYDDSIIAATMMKNETYSPLEKVLTGKGNRPANE